MNLVTPNSQHIGDRVKCLGHFAILHRRDYTVADRDIKLLLILVEDSCGIRFAYDADLQLFYKSEMLISRLTLTFILLLAQYAKHHP